MGTKHEYEKDDTVSFQITPHRLCSTFFFSDTVIVSAVGGRNERKEIRKEARFTVISPNTVDNKKNASIDRLLDVQSGFLLRSTELSGWPDASSSMCALMLPQTLSVNEALPTLSTLVGSLSSVQPVVHLQFLSSGVAFPTDATNERSVFNVGLVMCC